MLKRLFDSKNKKKSIVSLGGGTGQFYLLSGLKEYVGNNLEIKAIVTTLDNGGSSGKLITHFGVLPPGDIRNCLVALSDESKILNELFQYRFDEKLDSHNFGNLLLTALNDVTGSFDKAVKVASRILRIKGEVVPVSLKNNNLVAELEDGRKLIGETLIDTTPDKKIVKLSLQEKPITNKRAIEVLNNADLIVFGPGDLYSSILPNVLFPKVREAIRNNKKAKKILIAPVMSKPGETDDFDISDIVKEIEKYLNSKIDLVVVNSHVPTSLALKEYRKENKHPVSLDEENLKSYKIIKGNFIDEDKLVRHNPQKLAKALVELL